MNRLTAVLIGLLISYATQAKGTYQIDVIIFAHPHSSSLSLEANTPMIPTSKKAVTLAKSSMQTKQAYTLLPPSQSGLHDEYYLLSRKSAFKVLGQYTWRQTLGKEQKVALPPINSQGWLIEGTIQVQRNSYYLFNAQLQGSPPSNPTSSFTVSQKQRLKEGAVYYLDHEYLGMIVKINPVA
jgi:hypothetical protein